MSDLREYDECRWCAERLVYPIHRLGGYCHREYCEARVDAMNDAHEDPGKWQRRGCTGAGWHWCSPFVVVLTSATAVSNHQQWTCTADDAEDAR